MSDDVEQVRGWRGVVLGIVSLGLGCAMCCCGGAVFGPVGWRLGIDPFERLLGGGAALCMGATLMLVSGFAAWQVLAGRATDELLEATRPTDGAGHP